MELYQEDTKKNKAIPRMIEDYTRLAIKSIRHRQLRSWLTIIGIVVGIAAIVALISVSQGLENSITEQFEKIGANRLFVIPKEITGLTIGSTGITTKDQDVIEGMSEVEWVNPYLMVSDVIIFGKETGFSPYIVGMKTDNVAEVFEAYDLGFLKGRAFIKGEKNVVMLGYLFAKEQYDREVRINNKIKIKDKEFKVVGILEEVGNSQDDNNVYLPMDDVRELYDKPDELTTIDVEIKEGLDINLAAEKMHNKLKKARNNENFNIMTPDQLLKQMGDILDIVRIVLTGIAAISLFVGGVGIMNSMYTSVKERTSEIGIMKSVGATNNNILLLFLFEAGIIGMIGGTIGSTLGSVMALGVGYVAKQQGFALLKITIDWWLVLFGLLFAFIVGMISGALPARQASKLKPAEALRE